MACRINDNDSIIFRSHWNIFLSDNVYYFNSVLWYGKFSKGSLDIAQCRKCGTPSKDRTYYSLVHNLVRQAC